MDLLDATDNANLAALAAHDVRFVVIGGHALRFYGMEDRIPDDLDVAIDNARANAAQVIEALRSLGQSPPSLDLLSQPRQRVKLDPKLGLGILTSVCIPFDELLRESVPYPAIVPVRVVSLQHLKRLKRDACEHEDNPDHRAKHCADLAALEALDAGTR